MLKKRKKLIKRIAVGIALVLLLGMATLAIMIASFLGNLPTPEQITSHEVSQSTKIFDRTGQVLLYEIHGEENRTIVPFDQIPASVKNATIAIEDQNFYNHPAFDWRGILRAILKDVRGLSKNQGGSTITQQLAKNAFLSNEKTITRKLKELLLALRLEKQYSKDQILELYLNQIPYGGNAYGIEAAAKTYFNKSAKDLTLAQSALLASLIQAPTYYSPWGSHLNELLQRKDVILQEMKSLGFISEAEAKTAKAEKLIFLGQLTAIQAPHFVIAVQDYLSKKYGDDTLQIGGLKVITTLDVKLQKIAEAAVKTGAARNTELYKGKNAALFAEDPKTGQVLAMVGSHDYFDTKNEGNFNVATQGLRQPGSSFKPLAYVTAFKEGYAPNTVLFDLPTEFDTTGIPSRSYQPQNFDDAFRGPMTLRNALAQSINIVAVKVMYLAGIDNILKTAQDFGITTLTERSRYGLSLVLGGGEVKLSEMVGAYGVFATEGVHRDQTMVLSVQDSRGNTLESFEDKPKNVIEPQYTRLINDILSDVNARSPLFSASLGLTIFSDRDVALKTGTTNNYVDAWTIGYTPSLVAGVWAGNNHREPLEKHGGSILAAVPIWSEFMKKALEGTPPETFTKPDPIVTSKPVLNGDYKANNQIHTILYYVDKKNPQGPRPINPESDPQFQNWETPILKWASENLPGFGSYNEPGSDIINNAPANNTNASGGGPTIQIFSPQVGSTAQDPFMVSFTVSSSETIKHITVYMNDTAIESIDTGDTSYSYHKQVSINTLNAQNQLRVRAETASGKVSEQSVIFFR
jgi:1A family penicillin-binding protein